MKTYLERLNSIIKDKAYKGYKWSVLLKDKNETPIKLYGTNLSNLIKSINNKNNFEEYKELNFFLSSLLKVC